MDNWQDIMHNVNVTKLRRFFLFILIIQCITKMLFYLNYSNLNGHSF
jgi:hypothetical protein